jgi:REP element-mobilizing transposase RayT
VTRCTKNKIDYFGEIKDEKMILNQYGKIASDMWRGLTKVFTNILIDEYVIMPNHIHGIIAIIDEFPVGNASEPEIKHKKIIENRTETNNAKIKAEMRSLQDNSFDRTKMLLSRIIQVYKSEITRRIKKVSNNKIKNFAWQKSFYNRIIRNEKEFYNIQEYIHYNPNKWQWDIENPFPTIKSKSNYYNKLFIN